jgi:hypothetical protein
MTVAQLSDSGVSLSGAPLKQRSADGGGCFCWDCPCRVRVAPDRLRCRASRSFFSLSKARPGRVPADGAWHCSVDTQAGRQTPWQRPLRWCGWTWGNGCQCVEPIWRQTRRCHPRWAAACIRLAAVGPLVLASAMQARSAGTLGRPGRGGCNLPPLA